MLDILAARARLLTVVFLFAGLLPAILLGPGGTARAALSEVAATPSEPAPTASPVPVPRTTQDRLITVAALGSIVLVAVAGTYIYVLIRKGL